MDAIQLWREVMFNSLNEFGANLLGSLPNILAALFIFLFGLVVAKVVAKVVEKVLAKTRIDQVNNGLAATELFTDEVKKYKFSMIISRFVYWVLVFVFITTATEILGMQVVTQRLGDLISYLPKLFAASVIAVIGIFLANFAKNAVRSTFNSFHIDSGEFISKVVFYFLLAIVIMTALHHADVDVSIITTNISMIVGAVALAFVVAFVLGTRHIMPNIALSQSHEDSIIQVGQKLKIGNHSGTVVAKSRLFVELDTGDSIVSIPNVHLASGKSKN